MVTALSGVGFYLSWVDRSTSVATKDHGQSRNLARGISNVLVYNTVTGFDKVINYVIQSFELL